MYWILPRKYSWISFAVMTVLFAYMAYQLVPDVTDDLHRYYRAINDLRDGGWDKMKEFIEVNNHDMENYVSVRYLFWIVSRTKSNHWLQTIAIAVAYGSYSIMAVLAQKRFDISKFYVYVGTLFFLSTYYYYDIASGVRNGLCFAIIVLCAYVMFVEKKLIPFCIAGLVIAFYLHSAGLLAVSLILVTVVLYRFDSVFVNFIFMFSLIGGNFIVQTLAEDSDNKLILSIAGRAERHVGADILAQETSINVNRITVLVAVVVVLFVSYYLKKHDSKNEASMFYRYGSLTLYFVVGSIFSGMIFMRFTRWIVPVIVALLFMIGMQAQKDVITEKGDNYLKYYAIPIERFLYSARPIIIMIVIAYSLVHLWYDYNGTSLTFAHFRYEWEAMGVYDYTW
ncbi:MAG: EpsG family protein [Eubacterium sp.]|nr:EpsG family protein [Eubacterium sp.]